MRNKCNKTGLQPVSRPMEQILVFTSVLKKYQKIHKWVKRESFNDTRKLKKCISISNWSSHHPNAG